MANFLIFRTQGSVFAPYILIFQFSASCFHLAALNFSLFSRSFASCKAMFAITRCIVFFPANIAVVVSHFFYLELKGISVCNSVRVPSVLQHRGTVFVI